MKRLFTALFLLAAVLILPRIATTAVYAEEKMPIVSPGIHVLAEENGMAKAGMRGKELSFDRDDFSRALNLSKISSITVTSVPKADEGKLMVGNTVVNNGLTVSGSNISLLTFASASSGVTSSSFTFRPNGASYEIECLIYMLDEVNYAPTAYLASSASLDVSTYQNVKHYGKLAGYDPDGDECIYEIVSYPEDGLLVLKDKTSGEYSYTPVSGYTGKDSFKYVVKDKYGNYSAAAEVSIEVSRASFSSAFDDMSNSPAHSAAIKMTEAGIMSGTQIGSGYCFQPDKSVSRAEFVAMAMQAIGIKEVSSLRTTDFADDGAIPSLMKGYVTAAYELGYVNGKYVDGKLCFMPDEAITRAEAAVIVGRMIDAATPVISPSFEDSEDIPVWAKNSVLSLSSLGLLTSVDGEIRATELMSRGDTAIMLSEMMAVSK